MNASITLDLHWIQSIDTAYWINTVDGDGIIGDNYTNMSYVNTGLGRK